MGTLTACGDDRVRMLPEAGLRADRGRRRAAGRLRDAAGWTMVAHSAATALSCLSSADTPVACRAVTCDRATWRRCGGSGLPAAHPASGLAQLEPFGTVSAP